MIDLGISKLMLIGVVALVVIGPEKLPRVARTVGNLLGRAQRYVNEVKSEVNRQIELEELKRMRKGFEEAASNLQQTVEESAREAEKSFESSWSEATAGLTDGGGSASTSSASGEALASFAEPRPYLAADFKPKRANWRKKQSAIPQWYKQRAGIRSRALSGAARVAKYRPRLGGGGSSS
jgi:sec-independent protein translocase protein TatB